MMSLWDALRMNMMISYQELVRTFPNVLNSDGTSNVIYDVSGSSENYIKDYGFYARYQNIGTITSGAVISNVLVNVSYE